MFLNILVVSLQLIASLCSGVQERPAAQKSSIRGWTLRSYAPDDYEVGIDHLSFHGGRGSGYVEYTVDPMVVHPRRGPAFLIQAFKADRFRGERIRVTAYLRSVRAHGDPYLWIRAEGSTRMEQYGLIPDTKGDSSGWVRQECVVDIAQSDTVIAIGAAMGWRGTIWLDDVWIEMVGKDVPLSGLPGRGTTSLRTMNLGKLPDGPVNLNFEE
jgi:hypothetical protein